MAQQQAITVRDGHMAVNVKVYGYLGDVQGATDEHRERAWDITVESFWEAAEQIAEDLGYTAVYSEGRSGGWAVPTYADYPDPNDRREQRHFLKFQKQITQLLTDSKADYLGHLRILVDEERIAKEQSERTIREFCQSM